MLYTIKSQTAENEVQIKEQNSYWYPKVCTTCIVAATGITYRHCITHSVSLDYISRDGQLKIIYSAVVTLLNDTT